MANNQQIKEHINQFAPLIQKYAKEYGYKVCSPIIAQSITESISSKDPSGWSVLKYKYYNMFGLKCGNYWKPDQAKGTSAVSLRTGEEYTPGMITMITDSFRTFGSFEDGVKKGCGGYFDFIGTKRYQNLLSAVTPLQYLQYLKADAYCTSSKYVQENMDLINKYKLDQYDKDLQDSVSTLQNNAKLPTLKLGMNDVQLGGNYILSWQNYLNTFPNGIYLCKPNGQFTKDFYNVIIKYQKEHGLDPDGIIGPKTWASVNRV